jgi:DNA-binding response OmpR family regulator
VRDYPRRASGEAAVAGGKSVLIVDDDADMLDVFAEVLLTVGISAQKAMSGSEALRLYDSVDPALVIVDERLLDMSGSDFLRTLRKLSSRAVRPALFITGATASVRCLPGDVVLEKPVEMMLLLHTVQSLVAEAKAR